MEDILGFKEQEGLLLLTEIKLGDTDLSDEHTILAEMQLSPASQLVGSTLKEIDFRRRFGCFVLALRRTGEVIREKIARITLANWDTLADFRPPDHGLKLSTTWTISSLSVSVTSRSNLPSAGGYRLSRSLQSCSWLLQASCRL